MDVLTLKKYPSEASFMVARQLKIVSQIDAFTISATRNLQYVFKKLVCLTVFVKVSNGAKIRKRYNQVPHLTQDTNGKVTNSQKTPQTRAKRSALSQQVTTKHI